MEHEELLRLLDALPHGDWSITAAQYPDARTVMSTQSNEKTVPVATDMTPEAAAFLVAARRCLPDLLLLVAEERAYYSKLGAENERLHQLAHDLSSQLLDREQEIYEITAIPAAELRLPSEPESVDSPSLLSPCTPLFTPPLTLTADRVSLASL